jgi:hypothetical protein
MNSGGNFLKRNISGQYMCCYAYDASSNDDPATGDAANIVGYRSIDGAIAVQLNDTHPTEVSAANCPGCYRFDLTQAETDGDHILFSFKSSTASVQLYPVQIYTCRSYGLKKGTQKEISFYLVQTDGKTPATGETVTVQVSQAGGAFVNATNTPATEIANGWYKITLTSTEMDAVSVALKMDGGSFVQAGIAFFTVV